ncbi:MAG: rhodanese-like domain-containing protein [Micropepsaceae bacterium]
MGYAGDITSAEAWELLKGDPKAQLVDVRTAAEWTFVGVPDLAGAGRKALFVEWQVYPGMGRNAAFEDAVAERLTAVGATTVTPVFFLCRSGARSQAAARAMTAKGFAKCFNVADGFEGDVDSGRHRGSMNGWKASGLPWVQS